jgi:hypothetical protein
MLVARWVARFWFGATAFLGVRIGACSTLERRHAPKNYDIACRRAWLDTWANAPKQIGHTVQN